MAPGKSNTSGVSFFPVSPVMLFPNAIGDFSVYLWHGGDFVLYTASGQTFSEKHRKKLHDFGVKEIYVKSAEKSQYDQYVEDNMGKILMDDTLPIGERSQALYQASSGVIEEAFNEKLPTALKRELFDRLSSIVQNSISFLVNDKSLPALAPFISHDYKTYTHCLHVFIFTLAILQSYNLPEQELFEFGLGAMLHDLGKVQIPHKVLNKRGALTDQERRVIMAHPLHGVSMCSKLPLSQNTINCILFHHEKMDGTGYPAGLKGNDIPIPVRAITVCDIYDALTTARPYAGAMPPYEALTLMRHEMRHGLDMDVFKRLVAVLGGAKII